MGEEIEKERRFIMDNERAKCKFCEQKKTKKWTSDK
jgi:hypothetical protein